MKVCQRCCRFLLSLGGFGEVAAGAAKFCFKGHRPVASLPRVPLPRDVAHDCVAVSIADWLDSVG